MLLKRIGLSHFFQVINSLSLDVVLGAIGGSYILLYVAGNQGNEISILALALAVWLIYTLDHLLDAAAISEPAETFRHRIHQVYRIPLWSALILIGFFCLFLIIPSLSKPELFLGSGLSIFVIFHWILARVENNQSKYYFKELRIATIYVFGISIPSLAASFHFDFQFLFVAFLIWIVASINLISISLIEKKSDKKQNMQSIASRFSDPSIRILIKTLSGFFLVAYLLANTFFFELWVVWGILLLIFIGTLAPLYFKKKFLVNESYRALGDWSFSLSFLVFL
jgi:hypothetical protein